MATRIRFNRRAAGGAAGAPASAYTAEPAYNMADGKFYIGYGDDGGGNATTVKAFAADDFVGNVPAGGTTGQVLAKNSGTDGDWGWAAPATGGNTYTATGNGIELTGTEFGLNYTEIATGISLADYALTSALTSGLAGKADSAHTHSASDITSGVLDIARIPVLPGNQTIVSSGTIANLTGPQQADIEEGTIVTTTDGGRWVYSGSGDKTLEASYVALADITPEWTAIANKPSFGLVATSNDYNDLTNLPSLFDGAYASLSGKPTLGTMAAQEASGVAITGGTIDGIVLDGGTF